jgi:hypothetical protein
MPPKIYAANVEDVGNPIKPSMEKKPRTEKQIAGDAKAKLTREAKAAAKKVPAVVAETPKETPKPAVPADEKVKKPRKRSKKDLETSSKESAPSETLTTAIDDALSEMSKETETTIPPKSKKQKVCKKEVKALTPPPSIVDDSEPPKWFKSYIMGVKEEQARCAEKKVSKKQTRFDADKEASDKWREPVTRERVNKTVDAHMQTMYSMVFPNRKF